MTKLRVLREGLKEHHWQCYIFMRLTIYGEGENEWTWLPTQILSLSCIPLWRGHIQTAPENETVLHFLSMIRFCFHIYTRTKQLNKPKQTFKHSQSHPVISLFYLSWEREKKTIQNRKKTKKGLRARDCCGRKVYFDLKMFFITCHTWGKGNLRISICCLFPFAKYLRPFNRKSTNFNLRIKFNTF